MAQGDTSEQKRDQVAMTKPNPDNNPSGSQTGQALSCVWRWKVYCSSEGLKKVSACPHSLEGHLLTLFDWNWP